MRSNIEGARLADCLLMEKMRYGVLAQTLAATFTVAAKMPSVLFLDPNGAAREVDLPLATTINNKGLMFIIISTATSDFNLTVKDSTGVTTFGVIGKGDVGTFYCDGTTWWALTPADVQNLSLGGTLTVAGATALNGNVALGDAVTDTIGAYGVTKVTQPLGATQAAITDNSGGVVSDTILVTSPNSIFGVHLLATTLANGQEFQFDPGFAGKLVSLNARTVAPVTTGAKAATVTGRVNAGALGGGGVIALSGTSAAGVQTAGSAITGANSFTAAQTFGFTVGSVTSFVEGSFMIECALYNADLAAAIAKTSQMLNKIRTDLVALGWQKGSA